MRRARSAPSGVLFRLLIPVRSLRPSGCQVVSGATLTAGAPASYGSRRIVPTSQAPGGAPRAGGGSTTCHRRPGEGRHTTTARIRPAAGRAPRRRRARRAGAGSGPGRAARRRSSSRGPARCRGGRRRSRGSPAPRAGGARGARQPVDHEVAPARVDPADLHASTLTRWSVRRSTSSPGGVGRPGGGGGRLALGNGTARRVEHRHQQRAVGGGEGVEPRRHGPPVASPALMASRIPLFGASAPRREQAPEATKRGARAPPSRARARGDEDASEARGVRGIEGGARRHLAVDQEKCDRCRARRGAVISAGRP
jgi:hypothetical protein